MDMNIINIQSITDIVTNSSTEVFIRIKETAINTVKELINNLLKISGSTLQADDLFTIEILFGRLNYERLDKLGN